MVEEDVRKFKTEAPSTQFTKFDLQKHIKFDQERVKSQFVTRSKS
jgi:hypothetical protein